MTESSRRLIVVGEKFAEFSRRQANTTTVSQFERMIWYEPADCPDEVIIGQGVEYGKIMPILLARQGSKSAHLPRLINMAQIQDQYNLSHQNSVHKHVRENVLISIPHKLSDTSYTALLSIQDSCELLSDHMTGQHIQGIVLVEAARQAMLSVSETYLLSKEQRGQSYFVLNDVKSDFAQFGFPLPTRIDVTLASSERTRAGALKGVIESRFIQREQSIATISIRFAAYDQTYIAEKEHVLAKDASVAHLDTAGHPALIHPLEQRPTYPPQIAQLGSIAHGRALSGGPGDASRLL